MVLLKTSQKKKMVKFFLKCKTTEVHPFYANCKLCFYIVLVILKMESLTS